MESYTLGIFANMYPSSPGDSRGIFIRRMVEKLESKGVAVKKAVKTSPSLGGYIPFYAESLRLVLDPEPDIFQAHYIPHSSIIPAFLKRKKPLVLKFHGDDGRIYPFQNAFNRAVIRSMVRRADHILTISEEIRERLIEIGAKPDRITPISSGVNTHQFRQIPRGQAREFFNLPEDREIVLFIGRLHPWKGIAEIIGTSREHPDLLFILAGPGNIPPHPDNCLFMGEVSPEEIPCLINASDLSILPSYTEGISNFIMESLSCEIPVIATAVGGNPELVSEGETGLLIQPKDSRSLSEAIGWMKDHPSDRAIMGKKGREHIMANHDEDIVTEKMIRVHQNLL